ncbi:MAG: hypothetical protein ACXWA9_09930 [Acidimicrobiia bacterium]
MITTLTTTRTLHLVDIENLVGDPHATKAAALDALTRYVDLAGYVDGDHVVVAANPGLVAQIAFDLPVPCSPHAARGENGADLILLAQAEPGFVADRYDDSSSAATTPPSPTPPSRCATAASPSSSCRVPRRCWARASASGSSPSR